MKALKTPAHITVGLCLLLCTGKAQAEDISGSITTTLTIVEDSRLVGDVTCLVADLPCISFGAPGITLRLNGFKITGRAADPPTNCATPTSFVPEDGISAINQSNVSIIGPGLVQKFRRHGIFLNGNPTMNTATGISVRRVTSNTNCFSGLQMSGVTGSEVIEIVSVRNAIASEQFPCGGNCISNSNGNTILRNVFNGNGSVAGSAGNNDFGVGLVGTSSRNLLQENAIGGNTNGILVQAAASANIIRRNIIAGNPPVQVSATFGAAIGFDIRDLSPTGANSFEDNLCLTYSGAGPAPCPNIPVAIETRILPVVGSTPGASGTFFKTSVQLHNSTAAPMSGRIVFHPSGLSGSDTDPALSYSLAPGQTQSITDLLPALGRSGLGSADVVVTSGSAPTVTARVFNDASAAGTTGFTEEGMRPEDALRAGQRGVLLVPADLAAYRMNIGVRTLDATLMTLTVRDAAGVIVGVVQRFFPAVFHEQQTAALFLNGLPLPAGGSVTAAVDAGSAILYGATVDNRTGDPGLQVARAAP